MIGYIHIFPFFKDLRFVLVYVFIYIYITLSEPFLTQLYTHINTPITYNKNHLQGLWYTLYMADKAPVQDKLSKILAELMWSVAGTVEEDEYAGNVYLQMQEDGLLDDDDDYDENMEGAEKEEYDDDNGYDEVVYVDNDGDVMQIVEMNSISSDDEYDESSEDGIDLDEIGENEIYEVDQTDSDDNEEESDSDDDDENPTLTFLAGSNSDDDEFNEEDDGDGEVDDEQQRIQDMNEKHCRGAHLVSLYISTFICTVRREWGNVDKHRVDKFYTAVRFMISEAYKYMSKRSWNIGIIQLFNDAIYNEGLAAETPGLTNGLRYHLIDICIDELAKVSKESALPLTEATFLDCLEPFFGLAQSAVDKNVQQRVMQNVLLKFLNEYSVVCAAAASTEDGEEKDTDYNASLIFRQVHVGTVSKFIFSIASDSETDERYRKSLYEMHKAYTRQIRLAGMDVDIDDHNSEEEEEEEEDEEYESKTVGDDFCNKVDEMQGSTRKEDILKEKSNIKDEVAVSIEQGKSVTTDVPSGQKKKRKKKNKTEKSEENGIANAPAGAGAGAVVKAIDHEPKTKSLSKNKRKEKQHSVKSEVTEVKTSIPVSEKAVKTEESTTPVTKSSKKKRKLQNGNESTDDNVAKEDFITTHVETPSVNSSKKKKSKKQQTSSPPSVHPRAMSSPDQASFEEELGGINDDNDGRASPSKRVSFGAVNRAKSHKASMKAIKTLDKSRWDTATRTPDKGILHPRIALMSSEKKKARAPLSQLSSSTKKGKRS